jgi:hypothetical protein
MKTHTDQSISQTLHHQEQMEAARAEFSAWWERLLNDGSASQFSASLADLSSDGKIEANIWAWRGFIRAKGLSK